MSILDVFSGTGFNVTSLTAAMNKLPYKPARLGAMGLFTKIPIDTLTVNIEERNGVLALVPMMSRGGPATPSSSPGRKLRSFPISHLPQEGKVYADDVQNIREFGEESVVEQISAKVNDLLTILRQNIEFTHEWQRINAVKGLLKDADGTTIYNWYTEFGISQNTVTIDLTKKQGIKNAAMSVKRKIEDNLGMETYNGIYAMCGKNAYQYMVTSDEMAVAYDRWMSGQFLRDNQARSSFEYAGVTWEEYRGNVGATPFVGTESVHFFPLGTNNVFLEHYGPANYTETVNTRGKPVYAKQERMKFDKGIDIEAQSNPLIMCCRPSVLVECTTITKQADQVVPSMLEVEDDGKAGSAGDVSTPAGGASITPPTGKAK